MVNNYTSAKKRRSRDAYTHGGEAGKRPDRATIVYANRVREAYRGVPVIIGGIERAPRFAHYDYWDEKGAAASFRIRVRIFLIYGMGDGRSSKSRMRCRRPPVEHDHLCERHLLHDEFARAGV